MTNRYGKSVRTGRESDFAIALTGSARSLSLSLTPRIPAKAVHPQNVKTPSAKVDAAITQQLAKQTAPYGPENDPTKPLPGADASYVFPPNRPLRSLLSGISGDKFEDPAFPGRRRESLDLGNSMGNMNPHYRSPSPSLQRAQSHEETRLMGPGNESPYSQWFRRPSLFDVAAHQRRTSRGNVAHVHHPAVPRQGPYDRPYDAQYRPAPLVPSAMSRSAEDANRYKNKRKRGWCFDSLECSLTLAADPEQLAALVQVFDRTPFPSTEERHALALRLGMTSRSVQIWVRNLRRAGEESDETVPKSSPDDQSSSDVCCSAGDNCSKRRARTKHLT